MNIIKKIENKSLEFPNKKIIGDINSSINYKDFILESKKIGTHLINLNISKKPIVIMMPRLQASVISSIGVLYSDNYYVIIDINSPIDRIEKIVNKLSPEVIIYNDESKHLTKKIKFDCVRVDYNEAIKTKINDSKINDSVNNIDANDIAFSIFTSGSTGTPKGVLLTHNNVIKYMDWFTNCFDINQNTIFGSQTPLYFSMSVSDMYGSLFTAATYEIIPKKYFSFPALLIKFLNERKVNTIYWVPSALGIVAKMDLFKYVTLDHLNKVMFAGEVMPVKYLNYWRKYLPNASYANLFGPTETTDICLYYKVDREFEVTDSLPIGRAVKNANIYIINNGKKVDKGEIGELCVAGDIVSLGYFKEKTKTKLAFMPNPFKKDEVIYHTGDLVSENEYGELEYCGRIDFQIKHMGYRIELGEVENAFADIEGINLVIGLYDSSKDEIILAYESLNDKEEELIKCSNVRLPDYMKPNRYIQYKEFPVNQNGKINRKKIKEKIYG